MTGLQIPTASLDTKLIYERLREAKPEEVIPYAEISALIGRNVQNGARGCLGTAMKMALRNDNRVFGCVRNEGVKRLNDTEIVATGYTTIQHIGRASRRAFRKVTAVQDFNALPNDKKIQHNAFASILGAIAQSAGVSSVRRIERKVSEAQAVLPVAKTLEAFRE